MARSYHPYTACEEFDAGMWRRASTDERHRLTRAAAELMRQPFYAAMVKVVRDWPISCSHNLSAANANRQAWLGQAGCCIAVGSPEECTRLAWRTLTPAEQDAANHAADRVISAWETSVHVHADQLTLVDA